jgi:hypothetical protein
MRSSPAGAKTPRPKGLREPARRRPIGFPPAPRSLLRSDWLRYDGRPSRDRMIRGRRAAFREPLPFLIVVGPGGRLVRSRPGPGVRSSSRRCRRGTATRPAGS